MLYLLRDIDGRKGFFILINVLEKMGPKGPKGILFIPSIKQGETYLSTIGSGTLYVQRQSKQAH
jgi:hypothetical protein